MWKALGYTVLAWLIGLYVDLNCTYFNQNGYLMLRILLPMVVLGGFILTGNKKNGS